MVFTNFVEDCAESVQYPVVTLVNDEQKIRERRMVGTYVLKMAVMNVPQGRLQLVRFVRNRLC